MKLKYLWPFDFSQISSRNDSGCLIVDPNLEPRGTPVYKLNLGLLLDSRDRSIHILRHHIPPVKHATGHILAPPGVTFDHLVQGVKARAGDLWNGQLFVVGLLGWDDGGESGQREVDSRVRNKVGLKLVQVHVQSPVKSERHRDWTHYLTYQWKFQIYICEMSNIIRINVLWYTWH